MSAHWFAQLDAVTAMRQPRTIHDFYGFPPELFTLQYPALASTDNTRGTATRHASSAPPDQSNL